jgi:hypothetical protein
MIYYQITQHGRTIVPQTFLEHDDHAEYQFKMVLAEGGRLACVYEDTRGRGDNCLFLMFDPASGESWPRLRDDETTATPGVLDRWRDRYRRLKAEHPVLPSPSCFDD